VFFIADIYCGQKKLVIEVDGEYHEGQNEYDKNRDLVIEKLGLTVLRIKNEELQNIASVRDKIIRCLQQASGCFYY